MDKSLVIINNVIWLCFIVWISLMSYQDFKNKKVSKKFLWIGLVMAFPLLVLRLSFGTAGIKVQALVIGALFLVIPLYIKLKIDRVFGVADYIALLIVSVFLGPVKGLTVLIASMCLMIGWHIVMARQKKKMAYLPFVWPVVIVLVFMELVNVSEGYMVSGDVEYGQLEAVFEGSFDGYQIDGQLYPKGMEMAGMEVRATIENNQLCISEPFYYQGNYEIPDELMSISIEESSVYKQGVIKYNRWSLIPEITMAKEYNGQGIGIKLYISKR